MALCADSSISVNIPVGNGYCSGKMWVYPYKNPSSDSMVFSTGMSFVIIPPLELSPLSGSACSHYSIIYSNDSFTRIGYKFDSSIIKNPLDAGRHARTLTTGNPDTVWANAPSFPDSLLLLDSIKSYYGYSDSLYLFIAFGKRLFGNCSDDSCRWFLKTDNFNAIMYVQCNDNRKMKIQIDSFKVDSVEISPAFQCDDKKYRIDSVHILWAADSAGNGIFDPASLGPINRGAFKGGLPSLSSNCANMKTLNGIIAFNLPSCNSPIKSFQLFDLRGSLLAKWQNPGLHIIWNTRTVPAGAYAASWTYKNRLTMTQRFVVKK